MVVARAIAAVAMVVVTVGCAPPPKPSVPSTIGSEHFTSNIRSGTDISKDEYESFYGPLLDSLSAAHEDLTLEIAIGSNGTTITIVTVRNRTGSQTLAALLKTSFPQTEFLSQTLAGRQVLRAKPVGGARPISAFSTATSAFVIDASSDAILGSMMAAFP